MFDPYYVKARILPAVFSIGIPLIVFNYFVLNEELTKFIDTILNIKILSKLTFSIILLFVFSEMGRFLGKIIFEGFYFKDELRMPTTEFLMFKTNIYSADYKNDFRKKVLKDFNISLPTEEDEMANENLTRTKIVETMALIRKKIHSNRFLLKHNIEYGAIRNMIGGAVIGIILSIFNIIFFNLYIKNSLAVYITVVGLTVYMTLVIFSKIIIKFYAKNYAKILYREYIGELAN
jgi:hypothetical protein